MSDEILFIEVISNERLRPKQIKEIVGQTSQPKGKDSTTYKWVNLTNGRVYVGIHKETSKAYWTSSTDEDFVKELLNPNSFWRLEILLWGSISECRQLEYDILTENDARNNPLYYNKSNGSPGTQAIRYDYVKKLREDIDAIRFDKGNYEFQIIDKSYIAEDKPVVELWSMARIQTRKNQYITKNLNDIRGKLKIGDWNPHHVIILSDVWFEDEDGEPIFYEYLIISGNHTVKAHYDEGHYRYVDLPVIIITPEIHENMSNMEIRFLSNELNRDRSKYEPYSTDDAIKECLGLYKNGNSWRTEDNKARLLDNGLTFSQIKTVYSKVEQAIINEKKERAGMVIMDWKGSHSELLQEKVTEIESGNNLTYITKPLSGAAIKLDRIYLPYHEEQDKRISEGKPKQTSITCLVYHKSEHIKNVTFPKLKSELEYVIRKENSTPINFIELEMYMDDNLVSEFNN